MVSTELLGRSRPDIQWMGASKCVPVCSPQEKLFQYQPGPRSSYLDTSSMRKGQHCPISGGSAICGNSGVRVCVRSMTRIRPVDMALTRPPRISAVDISSVVVVIANAPDRSGATGRELSLENLRVVAPPFEPLLRHIAGVYVFHPIAQGLDDRVGQSARTELRRRRVLVPLIVDRTGEQVDDADAGRSHLGPQALREGMGRSLRCAEGTVRREVAERIDRQQVDPRRRTGHAI